MEKSNSHHQNRDGLLLRTTTHPPTTTETTRSGATTSSDFVLQWGNRKRLRCMKVQVKQQQQQQGKDTTANDNNNESAGLATVPVQRTSVRVDRRVVRSDHNKDASILHNPTTITVAAVVNGNGYLNLRQRPASPSHRILRNSETSIAMRGHNNGLRGLSSPDRVGGHDKKSVTTANNHHNSTTNSHHKSNDGGNSNNNNHHGAGGGSASSETAHDSKKGGSSSGSEAIPAVWPPKFVIALTNKEKEEDFIAFKGTKLPQRPKKRAKFIQRTLNLVSPGAWLSDLTLERYEVREKKVSKKRPRGLKAMGNMESDSE